MTTSLIRPTQSHVTRTGRHRSSRPRALHLVDLENLVGGEIASSRVHDIWSEFVRVVDHRHHDLSTVAVSQRHSATAFFALPSAIRRVVGKNCPDGADLALIESVDVGWAAANFGQVIIASGDHIFAPVARQFRAAGLRVVQVVGAGRCSAELYRACSDHRYLSNSRAAAPLRPIGLAS